VAISLISFLVEPQVGMRSRKMLRDKYAVQREQSLRDLEASSIMLSFKKLRHNIAVETVRQKRKAEDANLMDWKRILNFRRRVIIRWQSFVKENGGRQAQARRAALQMIKSKLGGALRTWRAFAEEQKRQQYLLGIKRASLVLLP